MHIIVKSRSWNIWQLIIVEKFLIGIETLGRDSRSIFFSSVILSNDREIPRKSSIDIRIEFIVVKFSSHTYLCMEVTKWFIEFLQYFSIPITWCRICYVENTTFVLQSANVICNIRHTDSRGTTWVALHKSGNKSRFFSSKLGQFRESLAPLSLTLR